MFLGVCQLRLGTGQSQVVIMCRIFQESRSLWNVFNVKVSLIKNEKKSVRTTLKMYLGHLCPVGPQSLITEVLPSSVM